MPASIITPVTVLTGFLGSGKTTLVNRLVGDARFADTAILVNELGAIPIDHALVRGSSERIVTLAGGCICCRVAGDVVRALRELHFQRADGRVPQFRRVVIETTGLADPAPLLATLIEMPLVAARYALAGVVSAVDGEHGLATLQAHPEAVKQAAMADRLVVTKCDRADRATLERLEARLAALNPGAARLRSSGADLDPESIVATGLHRADGRAPDAAGWLNAGAYRHVGAARGARHDPGIVSFVWSGEEPVAPEDVESALETLAELRGDRILRLKGLVNVKGESGPLAVHGVQHTIYPPARLAAWPDEDRRTRIVVIGRDLEESAVAQILDSFLRPAPSAASASPNPASLPR